MPTKKVKTIIEKKSIETLLDEAVKELENLRDEMQEWQEKLDENDGLRETMKYSEVEECADGLDYAYGEIESAISHLIDDGGLSQELLDTILETHYLKPYGKFNFPRWARLGYVTAYLTTVREYLAKTEEYRTKEDFRNDIDGLDTSDLDGIDFPGMY